MSGRCVIIVPCYNEAARLDCRAFLEYAAQAPETQFIFVNDGSRDTTLEILQKLALQNPAFQVRDNGRNRGKAESIREGMLYALKHLEVETVGFWDADLATPLTAIDDMLAVFPANPSIDLIMGSRVKLLGRNIRRRAARHYLGRVFATVASLTLNLPVYDTQCGAKLFRASPELLSVLEKPFLSRWIFDVELIARFIQLKGLEAVSNSIYEYPLHSWYDVPGSKVTAGAFVRAGWELWQIRSRYMSSPRQGSPIVMAGMESPGIASHKAKRT
jgi:dolichyl-phosphate beta-glucosyltransferase